jgi:hypothetical protein
MPSKCHVSLLLMGHALIVQLFTKVPASGIDSVTTGRGSTSTLLLIRYPNACMEHCLMLGLMCKISVLSSAGLSAMSQDMQVGHVFADNSKY